MKTCGRCGRSLALSEFNSKNRAKGTWQSYCKPCNRQYQREHYLQNTAYYIGKAHTRNLSERADIRRRLLEHLWAHPCVDCGEQDAVVLQFDHADPTLKSAEIAVLVRRGVSWRRIKAEIDKCLVRCANCHQRRTARQFGWYRLWSIDFALVAQRIEHQPSKLGVGGSSPSGRTLRCTESGVAQLRGIASAALCLVVALALWPPDLVRAAPAADCIARSASGPGHSPSAADPGTV